jgi:hypothetical protein
MRSPELIQDQISKLQDMKPNVRKTSSFGDNHHDAIDAQVDVLRNKLTLSKVEQHYAVDDTNEDDERSESVYEAAVEANEWLFERTDVLPSDGWKELLLTPTDETGHGAVKAKSRNF